MKKVVIDTLAGDNSAYEIARGGVLAKKSDPSLGVVLVGPKEDLLNAIADEGLKASDFELIDCNLAFTNHDNPKTLAMGENHTSLAEGLAKLKNDPECIGIISCGSTGGLLVGSIFRLGMLAHCKIPALAARLYAVTGRPLILLDCGANMDIDAKLMAKFAKLGSALANSLENVENPRIGLLNVGKEEGKGNAVLKEAYGLLKDSNLNFVGNLEGHDIFMEKADVIVCDGYVGNVVLKLAESLGLYASRVVGSVEDSEKAQYLSKVVHDNFAYTELGASILLGPKKICLICHGSADRNGVFETIGMMKKLDEGHLITSLEGVLEQ